MNSELFFGVEKAKRKNKRTGPKQIEMEEKLRNKELLKARMKNIMFSQIH